MIFRKRSVGKIISEDYVTPRQEEVKEKYNKKFNTNAEDIPANQESGSAEETEQSAPSQPAEGPHQETTPEEVESEKHEVDNDVEVFSDKDLDEQALVIMGMIQSFGPRLGGINPVGVLPNIYKGVREGGLTKDQHETIYTSLKKILDALPESGYVGRQEDLEKMIRDADLQWEESLERQSEENPEAESEKKDVKENVENDEEVVQQETVEGGDDIAKNAENDKKVEEQEEAGGDDEEGESEEESDNENNNQDDADEKGDQPEETLEPEELETPEELEESNKPEEPDELEKSEKPVEPEDPGKPDESEEFEDLESSIEDDPEYKRIYQNLLHRHNTLYFGEDYNAAIEQMSDRRYGEIVSGAYYDDYHALPEKAKRQFWREYPEKASRYILRDASQEREQSQKSQPLQETATVQEDLKRIRESRSIASIEESVQDMLDAGNKEREVIENVIKESNEKDDFSSVLERRQKLLAEREVADSNDLREIEVSFEEDSVFSWVEVDKIIGRPFARAHKSGWGREYDSRKGRIKDIASILLNNADEKSVERVFHPNKPNERIKMLALEGPHGPLYFVIDGSHRVAGAMVANFHEIPCDVKSIQYPLEQTTYDTTTAIEWDRKIKSGLIKGEVKTMMGRKGNKLFKIIVRDEVVPWARITSQRDFIAIGKAYEKKYPNSLNNLSVPRDALLDPVASEYFLADRWKEWEDKKA